VQCVLNDSDYFCTFQVIAMIGIAGGCRREELYNMSLHDVQDTGSQLVITIPQTKTNKKRVFTVIDCVEEIQFLDLFKKYVSLRPKNMAHQKLFVGYRKGKCIFLQQS
jgi:integrase